MLLKISYFLIVSLLFIGLFHFFYGWFQENLCTYFAFPKVKKTDKIFEFVETQTMDMDKNLEKEPDKELEKEEGKKGEEMESEELFQFIDGL